MQTVGVDQTPKRKRQQGTWKFGQHFSRTIRRATIEDSDHLPMQGRQILPFVVTNRHVNSSSWRDYKSLVKYITVSVKV